MIKVGCCGFSTSIKNYFSEFNLLEVQRTFYKPPKLETAARWRKQASENFEFTVKAWQVITHPPSSPTYRKAGINFNDGGFFKPIKEVFNAWETTREIAEILKSRIVLFQTPPSFKETPENIRNISEFFSSIDRQFVFVWEPRGWDEKSVLRVCEQNDIVHCTNPFVSSPVYGKICYFRLHGTAESIYKHRYSENELIWLKNYCKQFKKDIYILFNNVSMREDAKRFIHTN